ncbi:fungal-specific transcription factor domain-containing protein [Trichoderma velutinum]
MEMEAMVAQPPSEHGSESVHSSVKRRRIALACNACRLRKSRCDGRRPSCSSCLSFGFDCQYEPSESTTNVIVRKEYVSDLDQRVAAVEQVVQRLNHELAGHLSACSSNSQSCPSKSSHPLAYSAAVMQEKEGFVRATGLEEPQDEDASTNGMAMTFVEERTSAFFGGSSNMSFTRLLLSAINAVRKSARCEPASVDKEYNLNESNMARASRSSANPGVASPDSLPSSMTSLPSSEEMDSLLDIYFDTAGVVFPFIHEPTMRETYAKGKASGWTRVRRTWLGTLNMIFAMASNFDRDTLPSAQKRLERSNVFFQRATELCGELSKHAISLEIIHYLLLVVIHCQGSQRTVQAWNIFGLLVRSAMALGLHSASAREALDPCQAEYRRRTWVTIYCLDKVLSAACGRPTIITDDQMVNRYPISELPLPSPDISRVELDLPGEFLAVSFRLYQMMSKSLNKQYAANVENAEPEPDDMAPLQASGELRKALRLWSASLPPSLRLCEPTSNILSENTQTNRLRVILTLRYYNLGILIHRPLLGTTIRYLFGGDHMSGEGPSYLIQLAIGEAHECIRSAQNTIELVHAVITNDQTSRNNLGMWWFTLYYVFTASLVILGRLLWAKHGQSAVDEAAVAHSKLLLNKAEMILQNLDHDDSLVFTCSKYIHNLVEICTCPDATAIAQNNRLEDHSTLVEPWFDRQGTSTSAVNPLETMRIGAGDMDVFQLYTSGVFDPTML